MEKKLSKKIDNYLDNFKNSIKEWVQEESKIPHTVKSDFLKFIYDFDNLSFSKEDFMKRKRVKSIVPQYDRCNAKRANGEQCTRKKKNNLNYCGTHEKGRPHGEIDDLNNKNNVKNVEIWLQDIKGIHYYIDNNNNVYKTEDIISNKVNPCVIAKYSINNDEYLILS